MVYYALQMEADREKLLVLRTNMTENFWQLLQEVKIGVAWIPVKAQCVQARLP